MNGKKVLGIDIGGSGIKGAIIDTKTGEMVTDRHRIPTPIPATPLEISKVIKEIVKFYKWKGEVGIGFPAIIQNGVALSAANIDKSFINTQVDRLFSEGTKCNVFCVNDADAAGLAEMKFGIGNKYKGVAIVLTIGTGIGSAIFTGGKLLPNTEFGHVFLRGNREAEQFASDAVRKSEDLSWPEWSGRFDEYLKYMEGLFSPDVFIIGGGISKKEDQFRPYLTVRTPVVMAQLKNNAGMIGAALFAKNKKK